MKNWWRYGWMKFVISWQHFCPPEICNHTCDRRLRHSARAEAKVVPPTFVIKSLPLQSNSSPLWATPLLFHSVLNKNDHLSINVLDKNDKGFCRSMNIFIPAKIRHNGKINVKKWPRNRLNLCLEPKTQISDTTCDRSQVMTHWSTSLPAFWIPIYSLIVTNFIWPYLHQFFNDSHGLNGYRRPLKRPFDRYQSRLEAINNGRDIRQINW